MMNIQSPFRTIARPAGVVFSFLSDFNNFESLMPSQITNWRSDADSCSFTIQGMADIDLRMEKKEPDSLIRVVSEGRSPFPIAMVWDLKPSGENCEAALRIEAELNPMLSMMVKAPLQNFVDLLSAKLVELADSGRF